VRKSSSIARSNVPGEFASPQWPKAYLETNALICAVGLHMKQFIESEGYVAKVTPLIHNFDPQRLVSDWSHRHAAFVAGLGRFGLNNMLITESGCCGRAGSFLTSLKLPPDPRPKAEACLYHHNGSCERSVSRFVGGALFIENFYRHKCYQVCLKNEKKYVSLGKADVCGKCLVGVPCSFKNPVKEQDANAG